MLKPSRAASCVWLIAVAAALMHVTESEADSGQCVGYEFHEIRDYSRSYQLTGNGPITYRPIHYALWFPSRDCSGRRLTWHDYLVDAARQQELHLHQSTASDSTLRALVGLTRGERFPLDAAKHMTIAHRQAKPSAIRGAVIYIHASAIEAHAIAEELAERGFITAALTWRGTRRQAFDVGASGLVSELDDAREVLATLRQRFGEELPPAFTTIGTSFGALTALCWHFGEPLMRTMVSLDGGIATPTADRLMPSCPYSAVSKGSGTLLHLFDSTYEEVTFSYLRSLSGLSLVRMPMSGLQHRDYHSSVLLRVATDSSERGERLRAQFLELVDTVADFIECNDRPPSQSGCDPESNPLPNYPLKFP